MSSDKIFEQFIQYEKCTNYAKLHINESKEYKYYKKMKFDEWAATSENLYSRPIETKEVIRLRQNYLNKNKNLECYEQFIAYIESLNRLIKDKAHMSESDYIQNVMMLIQKIDSIQQEIEKNIGEFLPENQVKLPMKNLIESLNKETQQYMEIQKNKSTDIQRDLEHDLELAKGDKIGIFINEDFLILQARLLKMNQEQLETLKQPENERQFIQVGDCLYYYAPEMDSPLKLDFQESKNINQLLDALRLNDEQNLNAQHINIIKSYTKNFSDIEHKLKSQFVEPNSCLLLNKIIPKLLGLFNEKISSDKTLNEKHEDRMRVAKSILDLIRRYFEGESFEHGKDGKRTLSLDRNIDNIILLRELVFSSLCFCHDSVYESIKNQHEGKFLYRSTGISINPYLEGDIEIPNNPSSLFMELHEFLMALDQVLGYRDENNEPTELSDQIKKYKTIYQKYARPKENFYSLNKDEEIASNCSRFFIGDFIDFFGINNQNIETFFPDFIQLYAQETGKIAGSVSNTSEPNNFRGKITNRNNAVFDFGHGIKKCLNILGGVQPTVMISDTQHDVSFLVIEDSKVFDEKNIRKARGPIYENVRNNAKNFHQFYKENLNENGLEKKLKDLFNTLSSNSWKKETWFGIWVPKSIREMQKIMSSNTTPAEKLKKLNDYLDRRLNSWNFDSQMTKAFNRMLKKSIADLWYYQKEGDLIIYGSDLEIGLKSFDKALNDAKNGKEAFLEKWRREDILGSEKQLKKQNKINRLQKTQTFFNKNQALEYRIASKKLRLLEQSDSMLAKKLRSSYTEESNQNTVKKLHEKRLEKETRKMPVLINCDQQDNLDEYIKSVIEGTQITSGFIRMTDSKNQVSLHYFSTLLSNQSISIFEIDNQNIIKNFDTIMPSFLAEKNTPLSISKLELRAFQESLEDSEFLKVTMNNHKNVYNVQKKEKDKELHEIESNIYTNFVGPKN